MKILLITDLYPVKETEKNTPKTLLNFVKEWQKAGHTVDIIKPNFLFNSFLRGKPFYKTGKYGNVYNVNYWTPFWFINSLSTIQPFNSSTNYDLIIAHMPSGILFADKLGLPFVAGIHNSDLEILTKPLYKFYFKKRLEKALYNAKAIACRSYVIKDKLLKLYPEFKEKTFVVPSGIDEKIIVARQLGSETVILEDQKAGGQEVKPVNESSLSKIPQKPQNDANPSTLQFFNFSTIKILTCANLIKRKNIDKLILACKDIQDVELTVIGDGQEKNHLKKLDKNVIFTGHLEQKKVYEKMREGDIFILPSVNETFGMVYLEAMASGCITVCTENDGIAGIIKDGENGFLTEPTTADIKNTILRIKNLSQDDLHKICQNSFETIKEYTSKKVAENYLQQIIKTV